MTEYKLWVHCESFCPNTMRGIAEHFVIDTAVHTVEQSVEMVRSMLRNR
jgi:hypothetical protein